MIVDLWRYRWFIARNSVHDLRNRYAGSAMGVFWNVLNPLAQILVYTLVFSHIMTARIGADASGARFTLYLCAGILPWTAFSECVLRGGNAFVENANYLRKLAIPEQIFVAQSVASATLGLGISMGLLAVVAAFTEGRLPVTWLTVPMILVLFQAFGFGLGLAISSLNVFFRDIGGVLGVALQMWMWVTPVVYTPDILPPRLRGFLPYNPAYAFIEALHQAVLFNEWPQSGLWVAMLMWAFGAPAVGYLILRKLRSEIRDAL
jgi:lipopolysaccharide transport system permease protein